MLGTLMVIAAPPASGSITTPIWVLILSIAVPFLGVLATALVTSRNNSRQSKVSEREANTHEMDMILDGFKEGMLELRTELKDLRERYDKKIEGLDATIASQQKEITALQATNQALINQNTEQHNHIVALEGLIPSPPGVPLRPTWTRIPTKSDQDNEQGK